MNHVEQALLGLAYYVALVTLMRLAGKRLAGQTTTFDLLILISLGVVLQTTMLRPGKINAAIFVLAVFGAHRATAVACARSARLRRMLRGAPRPLVVHGRVSFEALDEEAMSYEELLAGLRKLGHQGPEGVRLATLEETGHVSVIAEDEPRAA